MPKRVLKGTVVSNKGDKSITVLVERTVKHPLIGKTVRLSKKYRAHDATNLCNVGDTVTIVECAPISKHKRFMLAERVQTAVSEE